MPTMLLPKNIANKLWISERTVYNYRKKLAGKMKEERRNWKTYFDFETISEHFQKFGNVAKYITSENELNQHQTNNWISEGNSETLAKLQEDQTNLKKYNNNLNEQIQKYAIAFSEEKKEKQKLQEKYDKLESNFLAKIEELSRAKWKLALWLALLGGLAIAFFIIALFFYQKRQ